MTKEERFILKLYELASLREDPKTPIKCVILARELNLSEKGIYLIIRDLAKANFLIKNDEEELVSLTDNGLRLVNRLLY